MSYFRIIEYLSQGGFKVTTSFDEYKELKKTCKVSAKINYICPIGHELSMTYGSFKNKKSKHKNNFEGFCPKCKNGFTSSVTKGNIAENPYSEDNPEEEPHH